MITPDDLFDHLPATTQVISHVGEAVVLPVGTVVVDSDGDVFRRCTTEGPSGCWHNKEIKGPLNHDFLTYPIFVLARQGGK